MPERPGRRPRAGTMDLTPTTEQQRLRADCRAWLEANLPWEYGVGLPPRFASLDEEVAFGRDVAAPARRRALGRRHLARGLRRARCRRARPLRRPGGAGPGPRPGAGRPHRGQPGGAHAAGPRHRGPAPALAARDPAGRHPVLPAVQRARRRQRPGVAGDAGPALRCRWRLGARRPEGVDVVRPVRRLGAVPGPHQPRRPQAGRHHRLRRRHAAPRASRCARCARSPASPTSTRCSSTRSSCPTTA